MYRTSFVAGLAALLLPLCVFAGPVDINTADAKTIAKELKGVGLSRAQAIVKSADELANVKGVGMKVVEQNRPNIKVEKKEKTKTSAATD